ncbi:ABC transporter permease subunit (plasmid) [Agrobacterium radiobacter]|uniref:Amino acid ABC transporter permease n=1 Tax=Agrobacterium tumefaciens str. B6 TaxID=1183423 RepID=A0A822VD41_AGRTU
MVTKILKRRRVRNNLLQSAFLLAILAVIAAMFLTARSNLAAQGMSLGFGFLEQSTGWNIGFSLISYSASDPYWRALWIGFLNTVFLGSVAIPLAALIGLIVAVMRISGQPVLRMVGATYVEIFRNIPLLLQLMFWYSILKVLPAPKAAISLGDAIFLSGRGIAIPWVGAPTWAVFASIAVGLVLLAGLMVMKIDTRVRRKPDSFLRPLKLAMYTSSFVSIASLLWFSREATQPFASLPVLAGLRFQGGLTIPPELAACLIAIAIYGAAFIAEILRAGFRSVPSGQIEASYALGLSSLQVFSRVRFPLAVRSVMPILTNQVIWLTKASTLGIAIGFSDLYMTTSTSIVQSGHTLELVGILMVGFVAINYMLAFGLNTINSAIRLKGSQLRG